MSRKIKSLTKIFLRVQRRLVHLQCNVKRTRWSDYVSRVDLSLSFLSSQTKKTMVTLPMCWSFFVISRSCTHSSERLKMRYESLRNVAMHFKAFKCVKNAFHSSAVVTLLLFELRMCGAMTLISSRITSKRLWRSSRRTKRPWRISILGSLLYLIYINDFHNCSKLLDFHLFADDENLFCIE